MSGAAIAGVYEHPLRAAPGHTPLQLILESARGAVDDAGLSPSDIDGLAVAGNDNTAVFVAEYLNLRPGWVDSTSFGGSSYLAQIAHAADAVAAGRARAVLVADGSTAKSQAAAFGSMGRGPAPDDPMGVEDHEAFLSPYGVTLASQYALVASRHMHLYGTTEEQLAKIAVTTRQHASRNPRARFQELITVDDVLGSRMIASPLHLLDSSVITDGGSAVVVVGKDLADSLRKPPVWVLGGAEAVQHWEGGTRDLVDLAAAASGPVALARAGVSLDDVDLCTIYDSFTITVLSTLEGLGFCGNGEGGGFVDSVSLAIDGGGIPVNPDGGALSNTHPGRRGLFLVVEAVLQLRAEAMGRQVAGARIALCHGSGGYLGGRHSGATLVLGR